jgi:hypothetical protein
MDFPSAPRNVAPRREVCRMLGSLALGALHKRDPRQICKEAWPDDKAAQTLTRAAVSPTSTANVPDVGPQGWTFVSLIPNSATKSLIDAGALNLDFDGISSIAVPSITTVPAPVFVDEGAPHPVGQAVTPAGVNVGPVHKMLMGVVVTRELELANPADRQRGHRQGAEHQSGALHRRRRVRQRRG